MAFSLRAPESPYMAWINKGCPKRAVFKYHHNLVNGDLYKFTYVPTTSILYISVDVEYYTMDALVMLKVDKKRKVINIARASCYSNNEWPSFNGLDCPISGWGSDKMFRRCLEYVGGQRVLNVIRDKFFGQQGWTWHIPSATGSGRIRGIPYEMSEVAIKWQQTINNSDDVFTNIIPFKRVMVYIDDTPEQQAAATKIQAHYKGWKTRMTYRYTPYTTLGKHLILKDFYGI
jgi:uncharacterized protein YuzE